MDSDKIKEYLIDFQEKNLPELIKRELIVFETNKIKTIIGHRRSGKTFYLFQKMKELLNKGIKKELIVFLNFEDPRLIEINFKEINEIIKLHYEIFPESINKKLHVFVDEPQNIDNWEIAVRALHDNNHNVFLSGSSSKLLSKEIATSLRGRNISFLMLPFSFKEFLELKKQKFELNKLSSKEKSRLKSFASEFIKYGSLPETINESKEIKLKILNEYLELVVFKDIIERNNIKNTKLIKWIIQSAMNSFSKELSIHKLYLTLKSKGIKASKNTVYSYISAIEDSFFIFLLPLFNPSIRKQDFTRNKLYLVDTGFNNLIESNENKGKKMENIVFLELKRRQKITEKIFYYKTQLNHEVDFLIQKQNKIKQLIQVAVNITELETKKRETRALIQASKNLKCNNLLIITEDTEKETKETWFNTTKKIKYIPLWKWLLKT